MNIVGFCMTDISCVVDRCNYVSLYFIVCVGNALFGTLVTRCVSNVVVIPIGVVIAIVVGVVVMHNVLFCVGVFVINVVVVVGVAIVCVLASVFPLLQLWIVCHVLR